VNYYIYAYEGAGPGAIHITLHECDTIDEVSRYIKEDLTERLSKILGGLNYWDVWIRHAPTGSQACVRCVGRERLPLQWHYLNSRGRFL
jgi:hypothetical protein